MRNYDHSFKIEAIKLAEKLEITKAAKEQNMPLATLIEAIYGRYKTELMCMDEVKSLVFRYFMGYWNHRRICFAIGGMPPMEKRRRFQDSQQLSNLPA